MNCQDCHAEFMHNPDIVHPPEEPAKWEVVLQAPALTHDGMHEIPGTQERYRLFLCQRHIKGLNRQPGEPLGPGVRIVHLFHLDPIN